MVEAASSPHSISRSTLLRARARGAICLQRVERRRRSTGRSVTTAPNRPSRALDRVRLDGDRDHVVLRIAWPAPRPWRQAAAAVRRRWRAARVAGIETAQAVGEALHQADVERLAGDLAVGGALRQGGVDVAVEIEGGADVPDGEQQNGRQDGEQEGPPAVIVGARMRLHRAAVVRRGALPADQEGDHADGDDDGEYEQGRHRPTPGKVQIAAPNAAGGKARARTWSAPWPG